MTASRRRPTYPNFAGKHAHDSFFTPAEFLVRVRRRGNLSDFPAPEAVILLFQQSLLDRVRSGKATTEHRGWVTGDFRILDETVGRLGVVGGFGIGAPIAAIVLEELIALGVRRVVAVGTAGTLQPDVRIGDLVLCDRAIRDEGVSHHYARPARYAMPSPRLSRQLVEGLRRQGRAFRVGSSWTIDAPYRETVAEARHYRDEGVVTVEMEAAALFAVAEHRGVEAAAAFAVSDSLAELVWDPQFDSPETQSALDDLFEATVTALVDSPP
jgi:uridine phosphorylase